MFLKYLSILAVRGVEGRQPFSEEVEASLLREIRKKRTWPCFAADPKCTIGKRSFRALGYHEKLKERDASPAINTMLRKRTGEPVSATGPEAKAPTPSRFKDLDFSNATSYNIFLLFAKRRFRVNTLGFDLCHRPLTVYHLGSLSDSE